MNDKTKPCGNKECKLYRVYYALHCAMAEDYEVNMQDYCKKYNPEDQQEKELNTEPEAVNKETIAERFHIFKKQFPEWEHINYADRKHESVIADWIYFLEQ